MSSTLFHCNLGVVQRTRGGSVEKRLRYQSDTRPTRIKIPGTPINYTIATHRGGDVLLPPDAPDWMGDRKRLAQAAFEKERRIDAQEGYSLEFALPRSLHPADRMAAAAFALVPFLARGMAVAFDIHCPRASDRHEQPHVHAWMTQRLVSQEGFGPKQREWASWMRTGKGRSVRALIAARINLACAFLNAEADLDHRSSNDTGKRQPERRIHPYDWRRWRSGRFDAEVAAILKDRVHARGAETKAGTKTRSFVQMGQSNQGSSLPLSTPQQQAGGHF
jgi:hypothetical protein